MDCSSEVIYKQMSCGVPQGSVLGPTLWNIGYDQVRRSNLPPGCRVVCYADDTALLAARKNYEEASHLAMIAAYVLMSRIEALGLGVAPTKTEAMVFPANAIKTNVPRHLYIKDCEIRVAKCMKYLGVTVEADWNFHKHFEVVFDKVD